jgi:phosphate transport system substrate-binding protein
VAYDALIEGDADLIFVTPPDNDAIWNLCGRPDDIDPWDENFALTLADVTDYEFVPVVRDALVFLNNVENPVEGLTLEQLQAIYQGKVINWKDVGGEDAAITAYQRPTSAGSQALFNSLLMGKKVPMEPPKDWVVSTMGFLVDEVANYKNAKNALGFSVYFYVTDMYGSEKIRLLAVDGIMPTKQNIAAETYPLCTYYYAVIRKDLPPDHPARKLVQWLLTDEGQKLAQSAGYVPLRPLQ